MAIPSQRITSDLLSFPAYTPAETLSDTTRHLCGAAYLDTGFSDVVIREVLEDERRAVPPSFGFDLDPVVRHCLRARRLMLARDAVVTGLVLLGLVLAPGPTLGWLGVGAIVLIRKSPWARRLAPNARAGLYGVIAVLALVSACCLGAVWGPMLNGFSFSSATESAFDQSISEPTETDLYGILLLSFFLPLALGFVTFLLLLRFRRQTYEILVRELAPERPVQQWAVSNGRIERRLNRIAAGQRGNITVQESDPFLGAGNVMHGWSFAITLRTAKSSGGLPGPGPSGWGPAGSGEPVRLDAVELVTHVRDAVLRMRDSALPERERVAGLYPVPHVVADGVRRQEDPLLEPRSSMPYSMASDEALEAIIRTPQGGLRYYERFVVPLGGKRIDADDGKMVLPAQSLGCEVAVFVHLAVEGGTLYAELMATLLPPVQRRYQLADMLNEDRLTSRAVRDTLRGFAGDTAGAPSRLVGGLRRNRNILRRMNEASQDSQEFRAYDYGARLSVREFAAEPDVHKFLQALDGWKYVKLLDRVVSEAIIDFLTDHGVDTTEFRAGVAYVHNQFGGIDISGGQVNLGGANVSFTQLSHAHT